MMVELFAWCKPLEHWRQYAGAATNLPGTHLLASPSVGIYQAPWLPAEEVTLFTTPGLTSLYF
jgi:hypothetical protein